MKRYAEKKHTARDYLFEDESDGFTISFPTFLTVLIAAALGATAWSARSFDRKGWQRKDSASLTFLLICPS